MKLVDALDISQQYRKTYEPEFIGRTWDDYYMICHVELDKLNYFSRHLCAHCKKVITDCSFSIFTMEKEGDERYTLKELSVEEIETFKIYERDDWTPQLTEVEKKLIYQ